MTLAAMLTNYVYLDQALVIFAGQSVFTFAKQLYWQHPERFDQRFVIVQ